MHGQGEIHIVLTCILTSLVFQLMEELNMKYDAESNDKQIPFPVYFTQLYFNSVYLD